MSMAIWVIVSCINDRCSITLSSGAMLLACGCTLPSGESLPCLIRDRSKSVFKAETLRVVSPSVGAGLLLLQIWGGDRVVATLLFYSLEGLPTSEGMYSSYFVGSLKSSSKLLGSLDTKELTVVFIWLLLDDGLRTGCIHLFATRLLLLLPAALLSFVPWVLLAILTGAAILLFLTSLPATMLRSLKREEWP